MHVSDRVMRQTIDLYPHEQLRAISNKIDCSVLKIVTWYGHLRDTFAGKNLITFSKLGHRL